MPDEMVDRVVLLCCWIASALIAAICIDRLADIAAAINRVAVALEGG